MVIVRKGDIVKIYVVCFGNSYALKYLTFPDRDRKGQGCGSGYALIWPPWIRNPDPGEEKWGSTVLLLLSFSFTLEQGTLTEVSDKKNNI